MYQPHFFFLSKQISTQGLQTNVRGNELSGKQDGKKGISPYCTEHLKGNTYRSCNRKGKYCP